MKNMKYKFTPFIYLFIAVLLPSSCSDEYVKGTYIASNSKYTMNMNASDLQNIPAEGGVIKTNIEASSVVNWEIRGLPSWLSTTTLTGSGSQEVSFKAESNESFTSTRTHIFNLVTSNEDWKVTSPILATQQNKAKSFSISPSDNNSLTFDSNGGQKTLVVTSNVAWKAECEATFVHISQNSAVQDLNIVVTVDACNQIDIVQNRTATIYFKDAMDEGVLATVTITQTPLQSTISTEDISIEFDQNKNSREYTLGNVSGNYLVASDASWLTIVKKRETNNVDITVSVEANENDEERTASAYVYIRNSDASNTILYRFSVKQKGSGIKLSTEKMTFLADGGVSSVEVNTPSQWKTSTQEDWITIKESGSTCWISVPENNSLQNRTGSVSFYRINDKDEILGKAKLLSVIQKERYISSNTQTMQFGSESTTQTIYINSNAEWSLSTSKTWISLSAQSGTGDSKVDVTVGKNLSTSRVGTLLLKCLDKTIEITIVQKSRYLNPNSSAIQFDAKGGEAKVSISSNIHWSIDSETSWITVSPNDGKENDEITVYAAQNNASSQRSGELTVNSSLGTNSINVTQLAPSLELSNTDICFDEKGGSELVVVTTDYDFSVTSSESWIKITKKNLNSFIIQAEDNTNGSRRTARITVQLVGINGTIKKIIYVVQKDDPYVDLGLPSGTKWCSYNKGASEIDDTGNLYAGTGSNSYNCPSYDQAKD